MESPDQITLLQDVEHPVALMLKKMQTKHANVCVRASDDGDHASEIIARELRGNVDSPGTALTQGNVEAGSACAWLCQEARVASITSIMQHCRRSPRRHVLVWQT